MSRSKAKGTAWETTIVTYLREHGVPHAERRALAGTLDRGDIAGIPGVVIEAKSAARLDLAGWLAEAETERANDNATHGIVWAKRTGRTSPADGYVVMSGATLVQLLTEAGYIASASGVVFKPTPSRVTIDDLIASDEGLLGALRDLVQRYDPPPAVAVMLATPSCTCPMIDVTNVRADGGEGIRTYVQGFDPACPTCVRRNAGQAESPDSPAAKMCSLRAHPHGSACICDDCTARDEAEDAQRAAGQDGAA